MASAVLTRVDPETINSVSAASVSAVYSQSAYQGTPFFQLGGAKIF
jgi:hypothetical protein